MSGVSVPTLCLENIEKLRLDLQGWTLSAVSKLLGAKAFIALNAEQRIGALLRCKKFMPQVQGDDETTAKEQFKVAVLTRLFMLGDCVDGVSLAQVLTCTGVDGALKLGLVEATEAGYRAKFALTPYLMGGKHAGWVASDLAELATGKPLADDHVLGVGGATRSLLNFAISPKAVADFATAPGGVKILDLGTGCGVVGLGVSRAADTLVASDISARALSFTQFNAALAGCRADLRCGSFFAPLVGEKFDQILSNPPFVITPGQVRCVKNMEYRDGGGNGDEIVADLVRGLVDRLNPGAVGQLLGNWEITGSSKNWAAGPKRWLKDTGLDAWVVQREVLDPLAYVHTWLRDGGIDPRHNRVEYETLATAWVEDFQARGVEAIGFGYICVRRPDGPALTWFEDRCGVGNPPSGVDAAAVLRVFNSLRAWGLPAPGTDLKPGQAQRALGDKHFKVASDVTEQRYHLPGHSDPIVLELTQGGGLARKVQIDAEVCAIVGVCDGELSLDQIVVAVAVLMDLDPKSLWDEAGDTIRDLIAGGFLAEAAS